MKGILTNHSFMLRQFRRELIAELLRQSRSVTPGLPFGVHIEDFRAMGPGRPTAYGSPV